MSDVTDIFELMVCCYADVRDVLIHGEGVCERGKHLNFYQESI